MHPIQAQHFNKTNPLVSTYSIVAYDKATGDMGVAVQSHWFSTGTIVTWGEAGVGVVATQSFANPAFGPEGLALLKKGLTAQQALDQLIEGDDGREVRQVAIVDAKGNAAVWTGKECIDMAGHVLGDGYSVQANMMLKNTVWTEMDKAYKNANGPLEDRLLAALEAAEGAGGDIRGKQSAAILVVAAESSGKSWVDRKIDLRIEDHPEPIKELKRLLKVHRAYEFMNQGDVDLEKEDYQSAFENYSRAAETYNENEEMLFWTAVTLANNGYIDNALPAFAKVFAINKNWKTLVERLRPHHLTVSDEDFEKILNIK